MRHIALLAARRQRWIGPVCVLAVIALTLLARLSGLAAVIDHAVFDGAAHFLRDHAARAPTLDPVIVGIDDAYVEARREPLDLMHEDLALFLDALRIGGARAAGIDVLLPPRPSRNLARRDAPEFNYDLTLLRALLAASRSYALFLGATWDPQAKRFRPIHLDFLAAAAAGRGTGPLASVLVCADEDGVVRELAGGECQPTGGPVPISEALAAKHASGAIDYALGAPFTPLAFAEVIAWAREGRADRLREAFAGRVVLLGSVMRFEDRLQAPLPLLATEPAMRFVPGVLLHAQMLRTLASDRALKAPPAWLDGLLLLAAALLAAIRAPRWLALSAAGFLLTLAGAYLLAHERAYALAPGTPMIALVLAVIGRGGTEYLLAERERRFLRRSFEGFVSPQVMRAILEGRVSPDRRGEQVRVAVLFADIRGFTTLSAARAPREVFELLNAYLAQVTKAIHEHRGSIDKFIGDGILAVFGYPEPSETPAREAIAAGRAMLAAVEQFNAAHPTTALKIGIGIHCGEVLAGALGSSARYEFTVIGDAVNVASRLEELTKEFSQLMVVSRHAWERAGEPEGFAALGLKPVRGRGEIEIMGFGGSA